MHTNMDINLFPEVLKNKIFYIQLCVHKSWTDQQVLDYAEEHAPCGIETGWIIHRSGVCKDNLPIDTVPCDIKPEFVHVLLHV